MSVSDLQQQHSDLMNRWFRQLGGRVFIDDGPVDFDAYAAAATRIVFVLKEPNIAPSVEEDRWSLAEVIDGRAATWSMLACWANGLQSTVPARWQELPSATAVHRREWLQRVAVINLHKGAGRTTTDMRTLEQRASEASELIREQLRLLAPHLVVACGTGDILAAVLLGGTKPAWRELGRDRRLRVWSLTNLGEGAPCFLAAPHPQAWVTPEVKYRLVVEHGRALLAETQERATSPAPSR